MIYTCKCNVFSTAIILSVEFRSPSYEPIILSRTDLSRKQNILKIMIHKYFIWASSNIISQINFPFDKFLYFFNENSVSRHNSGKEKGTRYRRQRFEKRDKSVFLQDGSLESSFEIFLK